MYLSDINDCTITTESFSIQNIRVKLSAWIIKIRETIQLLITKINDFVKNAILNLKNRNLYIEKHYFDEVISLINKIDKVDFSFKEKLDNFQSLLNKEPDVLDKSYNKLADTIVELQVLESNISKIIPNKDGKIIKVPTIYISNLKNRFELMEKSCLQDQAIANKVYQQMISTVNKIKNNESVEDNLLTIINKAMTIITKKNACNVMRAKLMQQLVNLILTNGTYKPFENEEPFDKSFDHDYDMRSNNRLLISTSYESYTNTNEKELPNIYDLDNIEGFIDFYNDMSIVDESFRNMNKTIGHYDETIKDDNSIFQMKEKSIEDINIKLEAAKKQKNKYLSLLNKFSKMTPDSFDKFISILMHILSVGTSIVGKNYSGKFISGITKGMHSVPKTIKFLLLNVGFSELNVILKSYTIKNRNQTKQKMMRELQQHCKSLDNLIIILEKKKENFKK